MLKRVTYNLCAVGVCYLHFLIGAERNGGAGGSGEGLGGGHCRAGGVRTRVESKELEYVLIDWDVFKVSRDSYLIP